MKESWNKERDDLKEFVAKEFKFKAIVTWTDSKAGVGFLIRPRLKKDRWPRGAAEKVAEIISASLSYKTKVVSFGDRFCIWAYNLEKEV